ncbi:MAG: tetratricopeptide repeat protein, partial [Planctomycetota bacterium]
MRIGQKTTYWLIAVVVVGWLAMPGFAATAADQLEKAIELFQEGKYQQAQKALLDVSVEKLDDKQKQRRDELVDEVKTAINQYNKGKQNLHDADKAFEQNKRSSAEKLYRAVLDNSYATTEQKQKARKGLALIAKQNKLEQKLSAKKSNQTSPPPTTRPAGDMNKIHTERNLAEAAMCIRAGDEAMAKGKFNLAQTKYKQALKLVPKHQAALNGLQLVRKHRNAEGKTNLLD